MTKKKYRIHNWKDYNRSLVERGSIEIWVDKRTIKTWCNKSKLCKRGRPLKYTEAVIRCGLTLKYNYKLPFRQLEGFMTDLIKLMNPELPIPNYSTICKRQKEVDVKILCGYKRDTKKLYILLDASGLKVFGEGEWKVRMHGYSKRRTWKKIHVGLSITATGKARIESMKLTDKDVTDGKMMSALLEEVQGDIEKIIGDGAYDNFGCYKEACKRKAKLIVPPRCCATTRYIKGERSPPLDARNKAIRFIKRNGLDAWKKKTHYHMRSLVENVFFRLKTIFGDKLITRKFENQKVEVAIKCYILNRMSKIGMPDSYAVTS